eukprot:9150484-Alexandrium_andersonii.AAC.1
MGAGLSADGPPHARAALAARALPTGRPRVHRSALRAWRETRGPRRNATHPSKPKKAAGQSSHALA